MANQVLNSQYGIYYNYSNSNYAATINLNSAGKLYFNADSNSTFNNCPYLRMNLQDLTKNISMDLVTNAFRMYYFCNKLTGVPVVGAKVTNASNMYRNCYSLSGPPTCGANVTDASNMYGNCNKLTGVPVVGAKVTNAAYMYCNCYSLSPGNIYMNNVIDAYNIFYNKFIPNRYNIFVNISKCDFTNYSKRNGKFVGVNLAWYPMTNGYYNTVHNLYVYTNVT